MSESTIGRPPTTVQLEMDAAPQRVFAEISDGWGYVGWVVGATHIRDVDAEFPAVGSRIHHQVGSWPAVISDETSVLASEPPHLLRLRARAWPAGEATIELVIDPSGDGRSMVTMQEAPTAGPGRWLDNPLLRLVLRRRNTESLQRLKARVENRPAPRPSGP